MRKPKIAKPSESATIKRELSFSRRMDGKEERTFIIQGPYEDSDEFELNFVREKNERKWNLDTGHENQWLPGLLVFIAVIMAALLIVLVIYFQQ